MAPVGTMISGALCFLTLIPQDLTFPSEFGILASGPNAARNSWIVGVVNAAPYLGSAAWCAFGSQRSCVVQYPSPFLQWMLDL